VLQLILRAINSHEVSISTGSDTISALMASMTPPYPSFLSLRKILYPIFSGRISLSVIFGFSQVSQPNRMSGLLESRRFHRTSRLLLMLWMFQQTDLNLLSNCFIGADFNGDEQ
jgi:hypothetical protein